MDGLRASSESSGQNRVLLAAVFLLFVCFGAVYLIERHVVSNALQEATRERIDLLRQRLLTRLEVERSAVQFLSRVPPVSGIYRATQSGGVDPLDGTTTQQWKQRLEKIFTAYIGEHPEIAQIRYIGVADGGRELVRVDRKQGLLGAVGQARLQRKGETKYFREIVSLNPSETYVSHIELNREYGKLDYPEWPTYRVARGYYDESDQLFGFIIVNYRAAELFKLLQTGQEGEVNLLLNDRGDFLLHPDPVVAFAFERGEALPWDAYYRAPVPAAGRGWQSVTGPTGRVDNVLAASIPLMGGSVPNAIRLVLGVDDTFLQQRIMRGTAKMGTLLAVVIGVLMSVIYSQRRAHQALVQTGRAERRYESTLDYTPVALVWLDQYLDVQFANRTARQLFVGVTPGEKLSLKLFPEATRRWGAQACQGTLEDGRTRQQDSWYHASDGEECFGRIVVAPIWEVGAEPAGVIVIVEDQTGLKHAEQRLSEVNQGLEQEVETRTRALLEAVEDAQAATRAKGRFLATMSHEIRTPLHAVFGMLGLMRRESLSSSQAEHLDIAENSLRGLSGLLNDILDFSRLEEGKLDVAAIEYEVERVFHACVQAQAVAARARGLELLVDLVALGQTQLVGDPNRIRQILNNLLSNAIKFTHSGRVVVAASIEPGEAAGTCELYFSVRDTGIGIGSDKLEAIFGQFTQADEGTAREFGGTGLGLSICRQLCELMHGEILVNSKEGEGSTFTVRLPQVLAEHAQDSLAAPDLGGRQALVALDNLELTHIFSKTLKAWGASCLAIEDDVLGGQLAVGSGSQPFDLLVVPESAWRRDRLLLDDYRAHWDAVRRPVLLVVEDPLGGAQADDTAFDERTALLAMPASSRSIKVALGLMQREGRGTAARVDPASDAGHGLQLEGANILVVDDHYANREVLRCIIVSSGARIIEAKNGLDAISAMQQAPLDAPIHLVLMDCHMPVMDGYQATERIRSGAAGHRYLKVPIIALTAAAMKGERERCLALGMSDYLSKPFEISQLEALVRDWLADFVAAADLEPIEGEQSARQDSRVDLPRDTAGPTPHLTPSEQVWDREGALRRMGNREDVLQQVLRTFARTAPDMWSQLRAHLAIGDRTQFREVAHGFKGIALNVGATDIAEIARHLERNADKAEDHELAAVVTDLEVAVERFLDIACTPDSNTG
ncbi:response regulator [Mangrovimicrobium sediminis]|uniref:histidine kinase n=1 Tax=Mangrovimicrobium sediminis TaxID=2562682 RepID=A0A4Z0M2G0_9GAMM|nr:ATP-binding protein [Haliea sp. SAOS-164]TGD73624.1 response regulator [Haliea sp. SAOS-164]